MAQGTKLLATKSEDPSIISGTLIVKGKEWTPKISSTTFLPGAKMIRNNGRLFPGRQKSPHLSFHFVMEDSVKTDQVLPGWLSKTPFVNKGMKGIFFLSKSDARPTHPASLQNTLEEVLQQQYYLDGTQSMSSWGKHLKSKWEVIFTDTQEKTSFLWNSLILITNMSLRDHLYAGHCKSTFVFDV